MQTIAALMTSFNRKAKTLSCLNRLFKGSVDPDIELRVFLVDDASPDGTAAAVREQFPAVTIAVGNGSLFWNGGMRQAFEMARVESPDYYLWLNDDVDLDPDAVHRLLAFAKRPECHSSILLGTCVDPVTGKPTYGGLNRARRWHPTKFKVVSPDVSKPTTCQTMNGNIVLVPAVIASLLGNLDASFTHSMGDTDYGFRARKAGFDIKVLPGTFGRCPRNSNVGSYEDRSLPFSRRWRLLRSPKGLPFRDWYVYTRRHCGPMWPIFWIWPYAKLVIGHYLRHRPTRLA